MLQSEFFERTKVSLTGEEYAKVEAIYSVIQMDKDEFCKEWLKLKDNPLMKEIAEAARKLEVEKVEAEQVIRESKARIAAMTEAHQKELEKIGEQHKQHMEEFGRKMVVHFEDDTYRYDNIAEEFGLANICKWKLEENYDLEKGEREFLIGKL